ncbi:MAG: hypothetical protein HN466_03605 [Candidatus Pacebacteria bacterium]|nr:hypothetical protein [Candidatus Paceibacterota bacterium]
MYKLKYFLNSIQVLIIVLSLAWIIITPPTALATDPNEIYVQQVPGLKGGLFGITARTAIEALIDDNYQVFCAAPTQEMSPEVAGEYRRFLELYFDKNPEKEKEIITEITEPGKIKNPLINDPTGDGFKNESIVNYQYRSKTEPETINANIITDGVHRQRSLYEQCIYKQAGADDVNARCHELEGVLLRDCALNRDIPRMAGIQIRDIDQIDCEKLREPKGIEEMEPWELHALSNTPDVSAIPENTRPAWLGVCFSQTPGPGVWFDETPVEPRAFWDTSIWSILGSFFIGKKDRCYIKYIEIPAAGTEQNPYLEEYALEVHDQGKKIFMSLAEQVAEEERFDNAKGGRKDAALGAKERGFSNDELINLKDNEPEFKKALAFIINGTASSCDEKSVRTEKAPTTGSDATAEEGGPIYKDSQDDAFGTWTRGGLFSTITAKFKNLFLTGKRKTADLENRPVIVRSYIFAPYSSYKDGKVSLESFFTSQEDYEKIRTIAQEDWETHAEFKDFLVGSSTNEKCESYIDYEDCHDEEVCVTKYRQICWIEEVCKEKSFCITGKDFGTQLSTQISDNNRSASRPILSLLSKDSAAWQHANETLGDPSNPKQKTNIERFLKGEGGGDDDDDDGNSGEELMCQELKDRTTVLPTSNELRHMVCDIAKNNDSDPANDAYDAQMLWGFLVLESDLTGSLGTERKTIKCGELIVNDCGASEIAGVLVPQCINTNQATSNCPNFEGVVKIANDTTDPWIQEVRNNPEIACDVETQLDYVLRKRKNSIGWIQDLYNQYNGSYPSLEETYLLMSGRNLGISKKHYETIFTKKVCENTLPQSVEDGTVPPISESISGCDGLNYCECAMNHPRYQIDCGNIK